jgi:hypothetical protein
VACFFLVPFENFKRRWIVATATVAPSRRVRPPIFLLSPIGHIFCAVWRFDFIDRGRHFGTFPVSLALFFAISLFISIVFPICHYFS